MGLQLEEVLKIRGVDTSKNIKVVRHRDSRYDLGELYRLGQIEIYQALQSKPVFDGAEYIVSFLGVENTKAQFIGVYQNLGRRTWGELFERPDYRYSDELTDDRLWYDLKLIQVMSDLKDRLIIKWGTPSSALSWVQKKLDKEIVEILPEGYVKQFPGYLDFTLTYSELAKLIGNPEANREWRNRLSSVAGVYLIVDTTTGKQYVGSASGKQGIWGRWETYVKTKHGGNKQLREVLGNDANNIERFQFTVLRTLSKTLTKREVIEIESLYKKKLSARAFGLNSN